MMLSAKQETTLRTIRRCAVRLAVDRGYDGFTMDDLAAAAGVSRRTVFNYVAGKEDAVFGPGPQLPPEGRLAFRAGEPTGNLFDDLAELVIAALPAVERDDNDVTRALFHRNPQLIVKVLERVDEPITELKDDIAVRLGRRADDPEIALVVGLFVVLTHHAFEVFNADTSERTFPDILRADVAAVRTLVR